MELYLWRKYMFLESMATNKVFFFTWWNFFIKDRNNKELDKKSLIEWPWHYRYADRQQVSTTMLHVMVVTYSWQSTSEYVLWYQISKSNKMLQRCTHHLGASDAHFFRVSGCWCPRIFGLLYFQIGLRSPQVLLVCAFRVQIVFFT